MKNGESRILMCAPRHFRVAYVINPWMEGNVGRTSLEAAGQQWEQLRKLLATRCRIELIESQPESPDMVFVANAGLVFGNIFIPSRFFHPQRRPESPSYRDWFHAHGFESRELSPTLFFEGEGDALFQPGKRTIWAAYGVRTSLLAHPEIAEITGCEVVSLRLVDDRFYHLDTCFCPLDEERALYYPAAFDKPSVDLLRFRFKPENLIEVSEPDALAFACNAFAVGDTVITNSASDEMRKRLGDWGYQVQTTPLTEFMRSGGSAKCLLLKLGQELPGGKVEHEPATTVCDELIEIRAHLIDTGLMNLLLDAITEAGGMFETQTFEAGTRRDQPSYARVRVIAPTQERLRTIIGELIQHGARVVTEEADALLRPVEKAGVAPEGFYSTTIYPTDVRVEGQWVRADRQRMDAIVVVEREDKESPRARCTLIRDLKQGDLAVCGVQGIRIHARHSDRRVEAFSFMSSGVSSERRVELAVEEIAWEMRRIRERSGKIVVVAGPVVVHTGGGPYLAQLIRSGYVQALLGGNAIAVHDLEQALFGTSLGVDMRRGVVVHGGHKHHLQAINTVREHGSIAAAVKAGVVKQGIMYECVKAGIPFVLAGSIRDDGPLPETTMDLIQAQQEYADAIQGAEMILMLSSMLHSIGTGNMTPSGVKLICVDISPAVVTKLADRGSVESVGIVTDVGLFLNLLAARLGCAEEHA